MEIKLKHLITSVIILAGFILFGFSKYYNAASYISLYESLLISNSQLESDYNSIKSDKTSLKSLVSSLQEENSTLLKEIVILKKKKQKIKYVNIIKYETKEVRTSYTSLPDSHLFLTNENLPICLYQSEGTSYEFKVLPVDYTLNIINTNKENVYKMEAHSSYNDTTVEIPINLNESKIIQVVDYPDLGLNINAGISLNYSDSLNISPVVGFPFIHLSENIDILSPEITFVENKLVPGLSPVDYKVSNNLSVLQDTWVGFNYSRTITQNYFGITIKSKF